MAKKKLKKKLFVSQLRLKYTSANNFGIKIKH